MATESKPNVLLICTDHWPGSLLGCAGFEEVMTPTLDQLAANGVRFTNAYSECPVCVPARRTLMTSLKPQSHGMLSNGSMPMPPVPTLAQCFGDAGYQCMAVGKLHVQPQRQRLGFDDVLLDEEGRGHEGCRADDYELFLADHGHAGQRFAGGMCNNEYMWRPWHLDEKLHVTNWAAQQMARQIIRRDPTRPAFWYLSFSHPHPPLTPLRDYLEMYRDVEVPDPYCGDWAGCGPEEMAPAILREWQSQRDTGRNFTPQQIRAIRRAFYAQCTHIDHQLRVVLGTLLQEGLGNNTIIAFTADHGDMLGNHQFWAKHWMYEDSARVPLIIAGTQRQCDDGTVGHHRVADRLVGLADVMPTLLNLAGLDVPTHCQGRAIFRDDAPEYLYGVWGAASGAEGAAVTRMIRDPRFKLVYYPEGNLMQLFDMQADPHELHDLGADPAYAGQLARLAQLLVEQLCGDELNWVKDGALVGFPASSPVQPKPSRGYSGQRAPHMPTPNVRQR